MEKNSNYWKNLLNVRINEYKMLNKTLCEVMDKDIQSKSISSLQKELDDIMDEINSIRSIANGSEHIIPDGVKNFNAREMGNDDGMSFYDSIVKQTKANEFVEAEALKECEKECTKESYNETKDLVDEFRDTADCRLQSNRFIVDFKDGLAIPKVMVRYAYFEPMKKEVTISIYDFIADVDGCKYPILEVLKYSTHSFNFEIKHLDANGNVIYTEYYTNCVISKILRSHLDYSYDDFSQIELTISYKNVEFEAAN